MCIQKQEKEQNVMRFGQLFQKALTGTVTMEVYKMQNPEDGKPTGNYIGTYVAE